MTLKTKGFDGHTISMVQDQIDEFLETINEKNFVDMKLVLAKREKTSPSEYYAAIIIYRQ